MDVMRRFLKISRMEGQRNENLKQIGFEKMNDRQ